MEKEIIDQLWQLVFKWGEQAEDADVEEATCLTHCSEQLQDILEKFESRS